MPYTFDPLFAADPNNPAMVAKNAAVLIFDPAVPNVAITITDATGSPIPNPITVNAAGFGPAFQHATLDRVGWSGGGFENYLTSYEGMKQVATDAKAAAQAAGATAGAAAVADVTARIAAGEFKGTDGAPGANGSNVLPTDTAIKDAINNTGSATRGALKTTIGNDGTPRVVKAAGDTAAGVYDFEHDSGVGYVQHFRSGANSGAGTFFTAYGTDRGGAGAILVSHKNQTAGVHLVGNPGSSILLYAQGYSTAAPIYAEIFKGSAGVQIHAKTGQGFSDGVTTQGSTTLTSATAAFVAGDVGKSIRQLTSTGNPDKAGSIPSGTTIASVTNGTTVVMSAAAGQTSTGIRGFVAGREPDGTQSIFSMYGTTANKLFDMTPNGPVITSSTVIQSHDVARKSLWVLGRGGQTGDLFAVTADGAAAPALSVLPSNLTSARGGISAGNAIATGTNAMNITNYGSAAMSLYIQGAAGQTVDQIRIADSTANAQHRFNKDGYSITRKQTAPALGDLINNECTFHFTGTAGAEKLYATIRNSAGALVTKEVTLV